jgi:hypothetical protein
MDQWTAKKALFGQNDYIGLLQDMYFHSVISQSNEIG